MGTFIRNLNIPFHSSEQLSWGGPATAQMILAQQGGWQNFLPGSPASPFPPNLNMIVTQSTLQSEIQANNSENSIYWATDPDGMEGGLDAHYPHFVIYPHNTFLAGSEQIVRTIAIYKVAVAALVYSGGHWVVVKGFQTTADPEGGAPWSIDGFWVHDPGTGPGEPPIENHYISLTQWGANYFFGNVYGPTGVGRWLNKYVVVGDPQVTLSKYFEVKHIKQRTSGNRIIAPRQAIGYAQKGIQEHMLLQDRLFKKALDRTELGKPILVARLGAKGASYYYIVPFNRGSGTSVLVIVDARYGHFREMASFPEPIEYPAISGQKVSSILKAKRIEVHSFAHSSSTTALGISSIVEPAQHPRIEVSNTPVWCPGPHNSSPFFPFYQVSIGSDNLYISSINGMIFEQLQAFRFPFRCSKGGL